MSGAQGTRFVGRHAELAVLRAELAAAMRGEGRLVLLVGEPGIGKTRTAAALAAEARAAGAAVVWGRCHESSGAPAYWPWLQALGTYAGEQDEAHSGEIAALLQALRGGAAHGAAGEMPERARFELFYRVVAALAQAARARPLLLVLDDLHWADSGSLLLLDLLAREIGTIPLCVLGTARDRELAQDAQAAALLSAVARLGRCLPLGGLSAPEVGALVADRLGRDPEEGLVREVAGRTDGNPFFVIEMLHLLAAGHAGARPRRGAAALPPGVQELLRQRLAPLPGPARRLLEIAAVVGRDFDLGLLARVHGTPRARLLETLAPALAADIVREASGTPQRYAFAHALMREAVYSALAPSDRGALHAAVGTALEASAAPDGADWSILAHHFLAAAQGGDPAKAIRYCCAAGERALDALAFEEAVRHFERALAAAAAGDDALRLRLLAGLAEAVHGGGDPARAETLFRDAIAVARRCGPGPFADTVLRCAGVRAEFGVTDVEMNALLDEALNGLPPGPSALRARTMVRLAAGLSLQPGAERRRRALADEATAMARGLGDPATLSFVLARRLIGLLGPDTLAERLATTEEILSARASGRQGALGALMFRADDLAQRGDRAALDDTLAAFEQQAHAARQPFFLWMAASFRAATALLEGRFAEAETRANDALALGQRVQPRTALLYFSEQLFALRGWQARFAEIEPFIEASVAQSAVLPAWRCALAEFYAISGRAAEARREYEALAADGFAALPRDTTWLGGMYLLAGVCARLRDVARAPALYDLLLPFSGRIAVGWPLVVVMGSIDERLGMLATVLERYEAAERHLSDALAIAERMRGLPWQADIRHLQATMLYRRGRRGDRERARALLDEAEAIARSLGMPLLIQWIGEARAAARQVPAARAVGAAGEPRAGDDTQRAAVLTLVPRRALAAAAPAPRTGTFRRDGDVWSLVLDGHTTRVRHMMGLGHIARLLREPEREVHVLELAAGAETTGTPPAGDAGELLDARARAAYEVRLRDARAELAEAEGLNDRGHAERLAAEIEFLVAELARGFGLGGRSRRAGAAGERARVAVTRAIRYAIDRIAAHDPALAEHLRRAVRTGTFCAYAPPTRDRVVWRLE